MSLCHHSAPQTGKITRLAVSNVRLVPMCHPNASHTGKITRQAVSHVRLMSLCNPGKLERNLCLTCVSDKTSCDKLVSVCPHGKIHE